MSKSAADFLQAGIDHMRNRAATRDAPNGERSMGKTVAAFNVVTGHALTEEQGWIFMTILKAVRGQQGHFNADDYEDGAAYFGLAGEAAARDRGIKEKPASVVSEPAPTNAISTSREWWRELPHDVD